MIHRKTLRRKKTPLAMTLKRAKEIYNAMTILHAKQRFRDYKNAYKYLLTLVDQNEFYINSLQLNNRTLAKGMQKEKENSGQQLRERLETESKYFTLVNENSALKVKLSALEQNFAAFDEQITHSMIPNLVKLSNDVTVLKLNSDSLRNSLAIPNNNNNNSTLQKACPKIQTAGARHPLFSGTRIPSPVLEETEDEVTQLAPRKCKGGLRNILNMSSLRIADRKVNRSLSLSTPNSESSFTEHNSNTEKNSDAKMPRIEHTSTPRYSPRSSTLSPVRPASPTVLLRRVLTPNNSIEPIDSSHSSVSVILSEKAVDSFDNDEENTSCAMKKNERKRSVHTSYFGEADENNSHYSLFTERKKSKHSRLFNNNTENRPSVQSEPRKSIRRLSMLQKKEEANSDQIVHKSHHKRSSSIRISTAHKKDEHDDQSVQISQPKKSLSNQKRSMNDENESRVEHCTLLSDRKKYSRSYVSPADEDPNKTNTVKAELKLLDLASSTFGNETSSDNSLNESRQLRNRKKAVCYKEKPLNIKLRKN